jgi:hypothetical protein
MREIQHLLDHPDDPSHRREAAQDTKAINQVKSARVLQNDDSTTRLAELVDQVVLPIKNDDRDKLILRQQFDQVQ